LKQELKQVVLQATASTNSSSPVSESDFLKFALKHYPHFFRDFSAGNAGPKAKVAIVL
jgi:hypothetical protein